MSQEFVDVSEIGEKHFGRTVNVRGMLICQNLECWLVPLNSERQMSALPCGLRVYLPGLGAEAQESPIARVTNGRPDISIPEVRVTGRIATNQGDVGFGAIQDVTFLAFLNGSNEHVVDLSTITKIAAWKMKDVEHYNDNPEYRQALLKKYIEERLR